MPTARRNQPHYNVDRTKRDKTRPWYVPGDEVHCDEPVLCETIGTIVVYEPWGWHPSYRVDFGKHAGLTCPLRISQLPETSQ